MQRLEPAARSAGCSRARAAIGRDALPRLPKGNGNSAKPEAPPTRRGKAPWRTARCACRLARSACRSSFPKISLRCDFREPYFTACGVSADADHLHGRLFCRWRCSTDLNRPRTARAVRASEAKLRRGDPACGVSADTDHLHQTRCIRTLCVYVRIRNRFVGFFFIFGHFRSRNEFDTEQLYLTEIKYTFSRVTVLKYLINKGINLI